MATLHERGTDCIVRLIRATGAFDRAYARIHWYFRRVRWELVLALASDAVLDRYNDLCYSCDDAYRPGSGTFREKLFHWEEQAITRFFPAAPARLLIGGAGGGREVFALAQRGYGVVAFERSGVLTAAMANHAVGGTIVEAYRAGYEQLPLLSCANGQGEPVSLDAVPPFDAAIIGWGSFTHLRTEAVRLRALQVFGRVTRGPILVSFLARPEEDGLPKQPAPWQRLLPARYNHDPGNFFDVNYGLFHRYSESEIAALAEKAGLKITHLSMYADETTWPHAILSSRR